MINSYYVTFFIALLTIYIFNWIKKRKKQHSFFKKLGIPFVKPNLFAGSFLDLRKHGGKNSILLMEKWLSKYGKVFGYYVGWRPYLLIADLELVKQVLVKDAHNFSNRPTLVIKAHPVVNTLVGLRDQRWKDVRSILAPTFSMSKMKLMSKVMNGGVDELDEIVQGKINEGSPVEWYSTYQGLTLDTISECALAMKTQCQKKQDDEPLLKTVKSFLKNAINPAVSLAVCFPTFSNILGFISNNFALSGRATEIIISNLKKVIEQRRKDESKNCIDVLQLMLDASVENEGKTSKRVLLSDEEIIANSWVFVLGGFETTASALTCTTFLLAHHPDVQEKLYREIEEVVQDSSEHLTYEIVKELPYLDQVFNESLRLYPPVVTFMSREAKEDMMIGDYLVPRNTCIQIPVWSIHRDPKQWPEPEKFDPERFSSESKIESNRHSMSFLPFGAGPRNCIGMRFATLEAKITLARIVRKYRLETCAQTPKELNFEIPTVSINPTDKILIKAVPRNN